MSRLDGLMPVSAARTGLLIGGANPKNALLIVAGGAEIAQTGTAGGQRVVAVVLVIFGVKLIGDGISDLSV